MKTFSTLIVALSMALTSFAGTPDEHPLHQKGINPVFKASAAGQHWLVSPPQSIKDCVVKVTGTIVVGGVQCTIDVSASASTCADATASAISQLNEAKRAIQEALQ